MRQLADTGLLIAVLALCGCGALERAARESPPPPEFSVPDWLSEFDTRVAPETLKKRMARHQCGVVEADMTALSMMAGISSRPDSRGVVIDKGTLANGADWFAMKDARYRTEPDALCGLSIAASPQGSRVVVFGIRRQHFAAAIDAVERGRFFCECETLSAP